ncbi:PriCT-2 domain-containing protein [Halomonas sp. SL1]|uniref:PriCT-2 domain-containing protein n=1 Tax=Halomonas sp. SL1 TaxID=2137478 RepID=UPI0011B93B26|nr:PriCT-2 domain-containing protein [Halomonas sp. SL1]
MSQHDPLTHDELRLALQHIPADDRETWVSVGNACKTEYGDDGFTAWDEWSQQAASYKAADAKSVWRSLTPGHVRLGTIIKLASDGGWQREKREMSAEDRRRLKAEAEERRKAREVEIEADEERRTAMQRAVGMACRHVLQHHCRDQGRSPYLERKQVGAHGVWFPRGALVISIDDRAQMTNVWAGGDVKRFFDELPKPRPDHISFLRIQQSDLVIPLRDHQGTVHSLQVIKANGTKLFPKYGRKAGLWHMLGEPDGEPLIGVAEGYATAASIRAAMGWPVAVALDAGNLARVAPLLCNLYPDAQLVICGDDDPEVANNPGRSKAEQVAEALGAVAVFPTIERTEAA